MITKEQMKKIDEIIAVIGYKDTVCELVDIINPLMSAIKETGYFYNIGFDPIDSLYKDAVDHRKIQEENYEHPDIEGQIGTEAWQKYYHACGPDHLITIMKRHLTKDKEDEILSELKFHYGYLHDDCLKCLYFGHCTRMNIKKQDGRCFMDDEGE